MQNFHCWIGYDPREPLTYRVCEFSIREKSPNTVVHRLDTPTLRRSGDFSRPWHITSEGQYIDEHDGLPFSTHFSHTRFLVPHLAKSVPGIGRYAMFVDADFLFHRGPHEILQELDGSHAVYVVKHDFSDPQNVKMDGMAQSNYPKKLWSALMIFDLMHPMVRELSPYHVNSLRGSDLHQFKWLGSDAAIGALDSGWNWISGHSTGPIHAQHFTRGTPELLGYEKTEGAQQWYETLVRSLR